MGTRSRLLTVGGLHVLDESPARCALTGVRPPGAVHDLGWTDTLALEAWLEGAAEARCGEEPPISLEIVAPVRMHIACGDDVDPTTIGTGERFRVQAHLYDDAGRELEVGKLTALDWTWSELLAPAVDRSAGEFGLCDTCYGMYFFRATGPGEAWISAALGGLTGRLELSVG